MRSSPGSSRSRRFRPRRPKPWIPFERLLSTGRGPGSFEFSTRGAYVFTRGGSLEQAKTLALKSISRGDVARIRFDPDLAELREVPEVRAVLAN